MPKQVTKAQYEEIKALHRMGVSQKDIAARYGKTEACISKMVHHGVKTFADPNPIQKFYQSSYEFKEIEEEDLSLLPDDVLFKHTNEFIF